MYRLILSLILILYPLTLQAATQANPAWRLTELIAPQSWVMPVSINLDIDERQCRKAYGNNWYEACYISFGEYGNKVYGIQVTPPVEGNWIVNGSRLEFQPETPDQGFLPDTSYTIDLSKFMAPAGTKLAKTKLQFKTLPVAVGIYPEKIFIDPSLKAQHGLNITLRFNYPVDPAGVQKNFRLISQNPKLKLGQTEFIWSYNKDSVNLSIPILSLASEASQLDLTLAGMPVGTFDDDSFQLNLTAQKKTHELFYSFPIPGQQDLFSIKDINLNLIHDPSLNQEYQLKLSSSLQLNPTDILKNMEVLILPQFNSPTATIACNWLAAPKITPEDLKNSTPVALEVINKEANSNLTLKLKNLNLNHDGYLFINIKPELTATNGLILASPWTKVIKLDAFNAEINFLQKGNVLALSTDQKLPVQVNQIDTLHYSLRKVQDPFLAMVAAQSKFEELYNPNQVSHNYKGELPIKWQNTGVSQFINLDLAQMLGAKPEAGLWEMVLSGSKDGKEIRDEYENTSYSKKLFLLTDLGILAKEEADGSFAVFVNNLKSGEPQANVEVQALSNNGQAILTVMTDTQGLARLPKLRQYLEAQAVVAIVAKNTANDLAWLPIDDYQRILDYTAFPIAGRKSTAGLQAFVFSQRGIYRPGENLYFGLMLRQNEVDNLPDLPVRAILRNPAGQEVLNQVLTAKGQGLNSLSWQSQDSSLSGRYCLDIETIGQNRYGYNQVIGSISVRLEDFQPDSLALQAKIQPEPPQKGWLSLAELKAQGQDNVQINVNLKNLHGLPAQNRQVGAHLEIGRRALFFPNYKDYIFQDPTPYTGDFLSRDLASTQTNEQGQTSFSLPLSEFQTGTQAVTILLEGFEPGGGRAVSIEEQLIISPLDKIVGYQAQGVNSLNFIAQNQDASLRFIAVDPRLQPVEFTNLQLSLAERRYVTSLVKDSDGQYRYDDVALEAELSKAVLSIVPGQENSFKLPTAKPGEYLLNLKDPAGLTLTRINFNVTGQDLQLPQTQGYASKLRLKLEKTDYQAGEEVKVQLSTPYAGYGLISLERENVATAIWFKAEAGESLHSLTLPANFAGLGYINVVYIRDLASPDIYSLPVSIAASPIKVDLNSKKLALNIQAPEKVKPGSEFKAQIINPASDKTSAIVIAVDEGVLQLTKFQTPDPIDYLFLDRGLDVLTRQAFDLMMFDSALLQGRIPAFGGDLVGAGGRFFNPFKRKNEPPLVYWSGVIELQPGANDISFPIPAYYNGKLRLMVVGATGNQAIGLSANSTVAGEIILNPQLPTHVAPGDSFTAYLNVTNNILGSGKDHVLDLKYDLGSIKSDANLPTQIKVDEGNEFLIPIKLYVPLDAPLGSVSLQFTARDITRTIDLSIRPGSPKTTVIQAGQVPSLTTKNKATKKVKKEDPTLATVHQLSPALQVFYPEEHTELFSLSTQPIPAIQALTAYLDNYEQGCIEQLISRSFPYIYLLKRPELISSDPAKLKETQEKALKLIATTQAKLGEAYSGEGIHPWAEKLSTPDNLLTIYAFDWLLSLREAGFQVPDGLVKNLGSLLERFSQSTPTSLVDGRNKAYAIWLLTREGRITTQSIEQLTAQLNEIDSKWSNDLTSSFLAAAFKIMRMEDEAAIAWSSYSLNLKTFQAAGYLDILSGQALRSLLQAKYFSNTESEQEDLIKMTISSLSTRNYSTFSSSLSLRALLETVQNQAANLSEVQVICPGSEVESSDLALLITDPTCSTYNITGPDPLYWQLTSTGYPKNPQDLPALNQGITIKKTYLAPDSLKPITQVPLGTEVVVQIKVQATTDLQDVVLTDILPGGFDLLLKETVEQDLRLNRREDRVLFYGDLSSQEITLNYRLRAVSPGKYLAPAILAEAMYDQNKQGRSLPSKLEVTE